MRLPGLLVEPSKLEILSRIAASDEAGAKVSVRGISHPPLDCLPAEYLAVALTEVSAKCGGSCRHKADKSASLRNNTIAQSSRCHLGRPRAPGSRPQPAPMGAGIVRYRESIRPDRRSAPSFPPR